MTLSICRCSIGVVVAVLITVLTMVLMTAVGMSNAVNVFGRGEGGHVEYECFRSLVRIDGGREKDGLSRTKMPRLENRVRCLRWDARRSDDRGGFDAV